VDVPLYRFRQFVQDALDEIPPEFGGRIDNVGVYVEDEPDGPYLGLYQGVPLTQRNSGYHATAPDRITIYRGPICRMCRTEAEVVEQVRRTVIHEVGHYFGISDARLRELGW
jgi:predicted Zn-dependent protease with MMP-like domain